MIPLIAEPSASLVLAPPSILPNKSSRALIFCNASNTVLISAPPDANPCKFETRDAISSYEMSVSSPTSELIASPASSFIFPPISLVNWLVISLIRSEVAAVTFERISTTWSATSLGNTSYNVEVITSLVAPTKEPSSPVTISLNEPITSLTDSLITSLTSSLTASLSSVLATILNDSATEAAVLANLLVSSFLANSLAAVLANSLAATLKDATVLRPSLVNTSLAF